MEFLVGKSSKNRSITAGWWLSPTPLKNMKVSWDHGIPNWMEKYNSCSKPPTRQGLLWWFSYCNMGVSMIYLLFLGDSAEKSWIFLGRFITRADYQRLGWSTSIPCEGERINANGSKKLTSDIFESTSWAITHTHIYRVYIYIVYIYNVYII